MSDNNSSGEMEAPMMDENPKQSPPPTNQKENQNDKWSKIITYFLQLLGYVLGYCLRLLIKDWLGV